MSTHDDEHHRFHAHLVEYLVIVIPSDDATEGVLAAVDELASRGHVEILDGAFVRHDAEGGISVSELSSSLWRNVPGDAPLGVLSERDLELIGQALPPRSLGVVVVVEDRWALPLAQAARAAGGEIAGGERIPEARIRAVLPELRNVRRGPE